MGVKKQIKELSKRVAVLESSICKKETESVLEFDMLKTEDKEFVLPEKWCGRIKGDNLIGKDVIILSDDDISFINECKKKAFQGCTINGNYISFYPL